MERPILVQCHNITPCPKNQIISEFMNWVFWILYFSNQKSYRINILGIEANNSNSSFGLPIPIFPIVSIYIYIYIYVISLTVDIFYFILYSKKSYFFSNERKYNIPKVLRILKYHHTGCPKKTESPISIRWWYNFFLFCKNSTCLMNLGEKKSKSSE